MGPSPATVRTDQRKTNARCCLTRLRLASAHRCGHLLDRRCLMTDPQKDIDRLQREMDQARDAANAGKETSGLTVVFRAKLR